MENVSSKRTACVFVENDYQELEAWYPILRLQEAGYAVDVVGRSATAPHYRGRNGYPCSATHTADQVLATDYDIVVIPGGWAPDKLRMDADVLQIVQKAMAARRIVGAICHAGSVLISADVVQGRQVTSWPSIRRDLEYAGALWSDAEVVVDGHLVTSRKPEDLPMFMKEILRLAEAL